MHKGGASMHIQCGSFLRRVVHRSSNSQMQITPTHNASRAVTPFAFSASLHPHAYWTTMPSPITGIVHASSAPSFLHNHRLTYYVEKNSIKCRVITHGESWRNNGIHEGAMPNSLTKQQNGHGFLMRRTLSSVSKAHSDLADDSFQSSLSQATGIYDDLKYLSDGPLGAKKSVVVVESPTKAKTIQKYLGPEYVVLPTYGHVRDLAARAGSVRPDDDYMMVWEVPEAAQTHVTKIKKALTRAQCLILASDPDREGEAIAWHVSELLKAESLVKSRKFKIVRVTFNEITKASVLRAMEAPRDICLTLVTAYLARRALDHLIGFALSPVLWRKLPGSRSAGRVQSVALKLVCEREKEIEESVQRQYWTVEAFASFQQSSLFPIRPTLFDGKKVEKFSLSSDDAKSLSERLMNLPIKVSAVHKRSKRKNPLQPYITSTLQMDAQSKLGYGAVRTMTLAQKLYEGVKLENEDSTGLITYMRTDGLQLSSEALQDIRALAAQRYGDEYVPKEYRTFNSKVKNAQEAHEAIRPTDVYRLPSQLHHVLEKDALLLYTLIWRRTMACQMEQAVYEEVSVDFVAQDGDVCLQASSSFVSFPGFLAAMEDKQALLSIEDEVVADDAGCDEIAVGKHTEIFGLKKGDVVVIKKAEPQEHFTRPPARYSEGLLVKAMEELGIGRPSTYATMLKTLESRKYVKIDHRRIIPEVRGRMVAAFLSHYFPKYIDYNFTARLEEQLDEVSGGQAEWKEVLRGFWPEFESVVASSIKVPIQKVAEMLQETLSSHCFKGFGINGHSCPSCGVGTLSLKLSRYGSGYFFGCNSYPDCSFKAQVLSDQDPSSSVEEEKASHAALQMIEKFDVLLGLDPDTNFEVRAKKGPFGYYIQLGGDGKQRRFFKIPDDVDPTVLTLEKAKELMKYPMNLGKHPEDGVVVFLGLGRKSFFIKHRNAMAYLPKGEVADEMTLERAIELLKGKTVIHRGCKSRAVLAAEEKKGSQQESKLRAKKATKPSTENGELKAEKLPRGKKIDSVAGSKEAKTSSGLEANVVLPTTQNEVMAAMENNDSVALSEKVKKSRGRKNVMTVTNEKVSLEANGAAIENNDSATLSEKAKKSRGRKKVMTVTSEVVSLQANGASPTIQNEVMATTEIKEIILGRSKSEKVVDNDDQDELEAKESVVRKTKTKATEEGKMTENLPGEEESKVKGKRLPKQVKIEVVPALKRSVTSARRAKEKPSTDDGEEKKSNRQKKEKVVVGEKI